MDDKELPQAVVAAEAHARRVRRALVNAQSEGRDNQVVIDTLAEHWRDHGETYKTVGKIVLNQLRLGLLAQLYGWREQLDRQFESQRAQRQVGSRAEDPQQDS